MHKIGRYEIERELGRGAMGIVYLARDTRLGRAVALKTMRLGDFADAEKLLRLRERLIREAQSAGSLSHENIVTIYDVDELDEISYISMEYVEGESLERMFDQRREVSREALLGLLRQIASGLDFAHSRGIIHRDIKPPNVMVTPLGRVKITDFGVAKITHASSMTQGGAMLGTPDYMSPEQIDGRGVDGRADQFSLGVIAFELLTGEKPFIADSLASLFYRIAHEPLPDASLLNPSLSREVTEVLARVMGKRPEDRYGNCMAFVDALTDACGRSVGWHALPRGMSHTLPTAHDEPGTGTPGVSSHAGAAPPAPPPLPLASQPAAPPRPQDDPPVRAMPPRGSLPPAAEAGFITGRPMDSASTVEGGPPESREWLRHLEEEEGARRSRYRRVLAMLLIALFVLGGGLAVTYYRGGIGALFAPAQPEPATENLPGRSQTAATEEAATGSPDAPFTIATEGRDSAEAENTETLPGNTPAQPEPRAREESKPGPVASASTETKPDPKPPPPPRVALATVRFMTEPPGARITVDAVSSLSCETPCTLQLPLGRHTYTARRDGYRSEIRAMEVGNSGSTVNVKLERTVGMVRVTSTPAGATVLVNGEPQPGATPITLRLVPGNYQIVIERDGRRVERNVNVREDSAVQLNATLAP